MNRIAASLASPDTQTCITTLHSLMPYISVAEIRLDLMTEFNLSLLIAGAPCPLIMTCRPLREGGRFVGPEEKRLNILEQSMQLGCAFVDIEWDSLESFLRRQPAKTSTRIIVSRHWQDSMPAQFWAYYLALRERADVVKLVGAAQHPSDILPVFDLLSRADTPIIAIAMGQAGQLTRVLAPCFASCLLTYAAPTHEAITASGQMTVQELRSLYQLHAVSEGTAIHLHLCENADSANRIINKNALAEPGQDLYVPLIIAPEEAIEVMNGLCAVLPRLTLTSDPALASIIRPNSSTLS